MSLVKAIKTLICLIPQLSAINSLAAGYTESQAIASTTPHPSCYNGLCRTPAKVQWIPGDGSNLYYPTPVTALENFSGSFASFCASLKGSYSGIHVSAVNAAQINGNLYNLYDGNCGTTPYNSPDYRGSVFPTGFCPAGYQYYYFGSGLTHGTGGSVTGPSCEGKFLPVALPPHPYKNLGTPLTCPSPNPYIRNPIHSGTGNKYQKETDYLAAGLYPSLSIDRSYNSQLFDDAGTGVGWQLSWYGYAVRTVSATQVLIKRPDGKGYLFNLIGGLWTADADITGKLEHLADANGTATGWRYTTSEGNIESYDTSGYLSNLTNLAGWTWTITTVDTSTTVSDPIGRSLILSVDAQGNRTITVPSGDAYSYHRDDNNNLASVTYPDGKVKTYLYENATFKNALTGIIDENNNRYATYAYDSAGRAISSEHAVGVDKSTLIFNTDTNGNPTNTVVTDPGTGAVRTYNFTTILGVVKSTGQSQPGGSGCAASASAITYDANGNVVSRADFNGNKTTYVYDLSRNLETSRTEGLTAAGLATAATRTITTTWHSTWRLPLVISEYSGATATGTPLKTTSTVYDDRGNITSLTEADPARSLARTTSIRYTYSTAVPGLVLSKVVDGPRTDVNDSTTYVYYPEDAVCEDSTSSSTVTNLGCRGQLQSVTNALGQITRYDRYNHHGQVEQITAANGLVSSNTYDARQRLLTHTVGTQTTTLTYDGVGQVIQLLMPDSSQLNYTYDTAHRLTQVQDTLGNKVVYTLDAEGNRTKEDTFDPLGNLAKTLTRSYDALNRLQTINGIAP